MSTILVTIHNFPPAVAPLYNLHFPHRQEHPREHCLLHIHSHNQARHLGFHHCVFPMKYCHQNIVIHSQKNNHYSCHLDHFSLDCLPDYSFDRPPGNHLENLPGGYL
ncbi:unnamed protein product [Meganyctiphanes norvegica]|uniref:Uncharacterized protein n=1 Tax=Meganyctiphanes norvegica TaxID=48144 RepID=A0AAV2S116_MEGNR